MKSKALVLALVAFVLAAGASLNLSQATSQAPATSPGAARVEAGECGGALPAGAEAPDDARVPPGCCTSNCNTNKDCDRICGKGNCVCIASSDCCRRCTY